MTEPLKITTEMRTGRAKRVDELIAHTNENIKRAAEQGKHRCFFPVDKECESEAPFYAEVKRKFEAAGYRIVPTGYNSGVWQKTEDIEW